jgi:hypothetical protein
VLIQMEETGFDAFEAFVEPGGPVGVFAWVRPSHSITQRHTAP